MSEDQSRIAALDGLRGVAMIMVMVRHTMGSAPLGSGWMSTISDPCWVAIDIFFVLSGFLITNILIRTKDEPGYFRNFFARRFLRVFPLYYLSLALLFGVPLFFESLRTSGYEHVSGNQAWLWLYGTNIKYALTQDLNTFGFAKGGWIELGHFWSLSVEEQFYLVWPFLLFPLRRIGVARLAVFCVVIALPIRCWFLYNGNELAAYMLTPCRIDAIGAGAFVAACYQNEASFRKLTLWSKRLALPSLAGMFAVGLYNGSYWTYDIPVATLGYTLNAIFFASLLTLLIGMEPSSRLKRVFSWRFFQVHGKYSYAMFIFHVQFEKPFLLTWFRYDRLEERFGSPELGLFLLFLLVWSVSFVVAYASWHLFEKRVLAFKRHFEYRADLSHRSAGTGVPPARGAS